MDKIIDFVHVGDYKTATTWLQNEVFPKHPEIQYLGDPFKNKNLQIILRKIVDLRDLDFDEEDLREEFLKNYTVTNDKIVGISREALSQSDYITGENAKRNAERLKAVFGDIKIIYVIRNQISMLGSIYSQYIKIGGTRKFKDWFLDPMECKGIIERLKYDKNIKMYHDIFGINNVLVLLYEELKYDRDNFLKKLFTFIGCKKTNILIESKNKKNPRLTTFSAFIIRNFNKFIRSKNHNHKSSPLLLDKMIYFFAPNSFLKNRELSTHNYIIPMYGELDKKQRILYSINQGLLKINEIIFSKMALGYPITVPEDIKRKILPYFKESNQILKYRYGLPIDKYGWYL